MFNIIKQNKRLAGILLIIVLLLLVPIVAMQFSHEVDWTIFDFVVAGILLLTTGLLCELVIRKVKKTRPRIFICLIILALFILIWAELAVGIFSTPISGD